MNHETMAKMIKIRQPPCVLCGRAYGDPDNPITVGHIISRKQMLSWGGDPDHSLNLQPECQDCNLRKGAS